jgi:hypothetical protein
VQPNFEKGFLNISDLLNEAEVLTSMKKRTRCHACNRYGHWKGDTSCAKKKQKRNDESRGQPQQQKSPQLINELEPEKGV